MRRIVKGYGWLRDQPYVNACPLCGSTWLSMARCLLRWKNRYFIECEHCHYCGKTAFTLKGALSKWNNPKKEAGEEKTLPECYGKPLTPAGYAENDCAHCHFNKKSMKSGSPCA